MRAIELGLLGLVLMGAGAAIGQALRRAMPHYGTDAETREAVGLATTFVTTVTSLTLSLLLYSTKTAFDSSQADVRAYATAIIVLGQTLGAYGPEAAALHTELRDYTAEALRTTWPEEFGIADAGPLESQAMGQQLSRLQDAIRHLQPGTPEQRALATTSRTEMDTVFARRYALIEGAGRSIPPLLLGGVIAWLMLIFVSLGMNGPPGRLLAATLALAALVGASCITLMDEMDGAFDGLIKVSSAPMRDALANLENP